MQDRKIESVYKITFRRKKGKKSPYWLKLETIACLCLVTSVMIPSLLQQENKYKMSKLDFQLQHSQNKMSTKQEKTQKRWAASHKSMISQKDIQ